MLKIGHPDDEKKETGQYNTQGMWNKAVEEELFLYGFSLSICQIFFILRMKKKNTGQYNTQ